MSDEEIQSLFDELKRNREEIEKLQQERADIYRRLDEAA